MPLSTELEEHRSKWRRLRDLIFNKDTKQPILISDLLYEQAVISAAKIIDGKFDIADLAGLRAAGKAIAESFKKGGKTILKSINEKVAFSLIYGARSVVAIEAGLLEYMINPAHGFESDTIRILDIGAGTGASSYGAIAFIKKHEAIFGKRVKEVCIDFLDRSEDHTDYCKAFFQNNNVSISESFTIKPRYLDDEGLEGYIKRDHDRKYDLIIAGKSLCELHSVKKEWWQLYKSALSIVLKSLSDNGVFLIIEHCDQFESIYDDKGNKISIPSDNLPKKLIAQTASLAQGLGYNVYSPCPAMQCTRNECWGWRVFGFQETELVKNIRATQKHDEKYYQMVVTKNTNKVCRDIVTIFSDQDMVPLGVLNIHDQQGPFCKKNKVELLEKDGNKRGRFGYEDGARLLLFNIGSEWKELNVTE